MVLRQQVCHSLPIWTLRYGACNLVVSPAIHRTRFPDITLAPLGILGLGVFGAETAFSEAFGAGMGLGVTFLASSSLRSSSSTLWRVASACWAFADPGSWPCGSFSSRICCCWALA